MRRHALVRWHVAGPQSARLSRVGRAKPCRQPARPNGSRASFCPVWASSARGQEAPARVPTICRKPGRAGREGRREVMSKRKARGEEETEEVGSWQRRCPQTIKGEGAVEDHNV